MNLDEGKALAITLAKEYGTTFEVIASRSQGRGITKARAWLVNRLYSNDLRDWQIASLLGKHVSTIWAYRHLDQKKASSNEYKRKAKTAKHGAKRRAGRSGRNAVERKPSA